MDTSEIEVKAKTMAEEATALAVVDKTSYEVANTYGQAARALLKAIDEAFDPIIESAHQSHKTALAQKKKQAAPVEAIKKEIERKMGEWWKAEQAKAAEARRAAEDIARRASEDAALEQAEMLASMGLADAAEDALNRPPPVVKVAVEGPPQLEGTSYREVWSAAVVDLMALVKAVAAGSQPLNLLMADTTVINGLARALKANFAVPGCEVIKNVTQVNR